MQIKYDEQAKARDEKLLKLKIDNGILAALKKKTRQPKKRPKSQEESWVCEECTYINDAKDFKCEMCFAPRTTSKGRKARRDPGVVQERVQQELLQEELDKRVGYKEPPLPMISDVRNVFTDEEMKVTNK